MFKRITYQELMERVDIYVSIDPNVNIGKKAIILPGDIFPSLEREIIEDEIDNDSEFRGKYPNFKAFRGLWEQYSMEYQISQVVKTLKQDLGEGIRWSSYMTQCVNFNLQFTYDNQPYEFRLLPLGKVEENSILFKQNSVMDIDGSQDIYRLIIQPDPHFDVTTSEDELTKKIDELYEVFTDPSKKIVASVLIEEQ